MYVKTQWVNNTTPINDTNLNKIEQGIYDNSLVVEAVTNTLNPTDTETYKTAELTEGQITDVIGVNDIIIKGQTSQDGTPTPSAPVDVNVVSGSNVINTSNKNLLNLTDGTYTHNGITANVNKGIITLNGTASGTSAIDIPINIKVKANQNYTLQANNTSTIGQSGTGGTYSCIRFRTSTTDDATTDVRFNPINNHKTFQKTEETTYAYLRIRTGDRLTYNNFIIKPQLEEGSTATTYEPHQGKELPLDLPVENLFDGQLELGTITSGTGATGASNNAIRSVNYIAVNPNTTYTLSNNKNYTPYVFEYNNSKTYISNSSTQVTPYTFTTTSTTKYIKFRTIEGKVENDLTTKFMLEKNIKATPYVPYGTDPIELCKIGNYQDYFYKSGSKWYLHKEIEKLILDGTENFNNTYTAFGLEGIKKSIAAGGGLCNYYLYNNRNSGMANLPNNYFAIQTVSGGSTSSVYFQNTAFTTVTDFKADLAQKYENGKPVTLYYPSGTATDTEITGTLKEQLEAIYNAPLYEQTNITQTNNDLPMVLDITACKDNINGIKAFIRK